MIKKCPISVGIPAYGNNANLLETIRRVLTCRPLPSELIIHCDGGWEPDFDPASNASLPVRLLHSVTKIGPGGGRDACIKAASYDLVASFDDDSWPLTPDYFEKTVALMNAFPDAAVLSPAVSLPDKASCDPIAEVWESRSYEGSASIHRRSLYLKLPGFVPVPEAYGLEEADIALQARTRGMQVLATSWVSAWHNRPQSDNAHGLTAWIRNELVLGWLRYPPLLQPWTWLRAVKRLLRDSHKVSALKLLHSALSAPALCAELKKHQARSSIGTIMDHHRGDLRVWRLDSAAGQIKSCLLPQGRHVLFLQFTHPAAYPPLEHSSRILADEGWQVYFLGLNVGTFLMPRHPRISFALLPNRAPGIGQKLLFFRWTLHSLWHAWNSRSLWIYCSDSFASPAGLLIRILLRRKVIYHEHDSPPSDQRGLFQYCLLKCRHWLGENAEIVIFPCEGRLQAFQAIASPRGQCKIVWNTPTKEEVHHAPRKPIQKGLRIIFHGSVVPERFPITYVKLLKHCYDSITMDVIGYETPGSIGYKQTLADTAQELGLSHRFHCLPSLPHRSELLKQCSTYDVGLALLAKREWDINSIHMAGASNKPFDYASQGVAVIVPDEHEWQALYVTTGCGVSCAPDDPEALARLLNQLHDHPEQVRAMGERGRLLCLNFWHYEQQFLPVLTTMDASKSPVHT